VHERRRRAVTVLADRGGGPRRRNS
jgi:hypothetical protein